MSNGTPNLFNALFEFRPRETLTSRENFLTEGFAYVLKTSKEACDAWVSNVLGCKVVSASTEIHTRNSERLDETTVFPDMLIKADIGDGSPEEIYAEHKWHADFDPTQLDKYYRIAKSKKKPARIVFIGSKLKQHTTAMRFRFGTEKRALDGCFLWEDVFRCLNGVARKDEMLNQFLDFMKTHGLNPGQPLSLEKMQAYLASTDFEKMLERWATKLKDEYDWAIIPERLRKRPQVTSRFGRIAVEFAAELWKPTITIGFLIDPRDHKVVYTNPSKGIDLLLRIEAVPQLLRNAEPAKVVLRKKAGELKQVAASVLLVGERGNGNTHSLLIVRSCLWDVIGEAKSEADQVECLYNRLNDWLTRLFQDGDLESAFQKSGLNGGTKQFQSDV